MRVQVRLLGHLGDAAGSDEVGLTVEDGASLGMAVTRLVEELPALGDALIDSVLGSYTPNALILVDGVEASNLDGPATPLRDGASLVLIPVTHGG